MGSGLIITIIPLISTLLGFYNFLYFITIGYGASISFNALALMIIHYHELNKVSFILCIFLILYGIRLCGYLIIREFCLKSYIQTVQKDINRINNYPTFVNILSWIFCSLLYTSLTTPVYYIIINQGDELLSSYINIGISIFGFILEIVADHQKTIAKKKNPKRFVSDGLYKIVRCPNYLGEIFIWIGFFFFMLCVLYVWLRRFPIHKIFLFFLKLGRKIINLFLRLFNLSSSKNIKNKQLNKNEL